MPRRSLAALLVVRAKQALSSFSLASEAALAPLALLIDGENISAELAVHILAAAGSVGGVTIRRVYGNWRHPTLSAWQMMAHHYGFQTIHSAHPVAGKNATDIALTVDAMDLLHQGIRHFCLASSDTDYIPLMRRLRADGSFVLGIGRPETHEALKAASTVFLTTDQLLPPPARAVSPVTPRKEECLDTSPPLLAVTPIPQGNSQAPTTITTPDPEAEKEKHLIALLTDAYGQAATRAKSEWVSTVLLGTMLQQLEPGFAPKSYGAARLKVLIQKYPQLFQTQPLKGGQIALRMKAKT